MSTTTTRKSWPTLAVAELVDAQLPEADDDLTADIQAGGIEEPLYVATLANGAVRVMDGRRRLAAAHAAGLTEVPVTYRPVIRVSALTAHPGNVRQNLKLTKAYLASIEAEGVTVPMKIRRVDDGTLRVTDGHRRLAAAVKVGIEFVPYEYDEGDEADDFLIMVTTAEHRTGLSNAEKAHALFAAADLGAGVRRMAAAAGISQKAAKAAAKAGGATAVQKAAATGAALGMDDLVRLAELQDADPEAAAVITRTMEDDPSRDHGWQIARAMTVIEHRREAEAHRAELEKAGVVIRPYGELTAALPVAQLLDVKKADDHSACQGDVWALRHGSRSYARYCANPAFYGHKTYGAETKNKPSASERKAIIAGNVDWDTAQRLREEWLIKLISRKTHTKAQNDAFTQATARALLSGSDVITSRLTHPKTAERIARYLGVKQTRTDLAKRADNTRRAACQAFATVAAMHEAYLPRTAWRTDNGHGGAQVRKVAAQWLRTLQAMGYELSAVEAATAAEETYNPSAQALTKGGTLN